MPRWLFIITALLGLLIVLAVAAARLELMPPSPALLIVAGLTGIMVVLAAFAVVVAVMRWFQGQGIGAGCIGAFVVGLLPAVIMLVTVGLEGFQAPPINDISTDTHNPPAFVLAASDRGPGDNAAAHPGETVFEIQRQYYPDVGPLFTPAAPDQVMAAVEGVIRGLGWEVLGIDDEERRLEAVARTGLFGFRDDIVIRVAADGDGSRVDIRSASRLGQGDLGANARRVRMLLETFADEMGSSQGNFPGKA